MSTEYVHDKEGNTFIKSTKRADGTWRKERKVKQGYLPQEEVPLYESKGKKIAKEAIANEGLPAGLTREAWEKMKEAQAKLLNPQMKAPKKKNNKKKKSATTNQSAVDNQNDINQLNNVEQTEQKTVAVKKKKNKQIDNENNSSTTVNETISSTLSSNTQNASPSDDWVTMGKPKPTKKSTNTANLDKAIKNLALDKKSNKQVKKRSTANELPTSKVGVDDIANDMLIDDFHDEENEEKKKIEKNNEKQLLIKKIKTLKRKIKEVETLKELRKQKILDKEQTEKVNKGDQFVNELTKLQAKLENITTEK